MRKKTGVAQKALDALDVASSKTYSWCTCGCSARQPCCDVSDQGTDLDPATFTAEKSGTVYLFGCKRTRSQPFCDRTDQEL